jgi:D-alanyl-lipoteichoic acid acyltransferase DltB (MBOAT superfamily)
MAWLGIASIIFYSWLGTRYLPLLIFSIIFNYSVGVGLEKFSARERLAYWLLFFGVSVNLLVLVYYKYLFDLTGWAHVHGLFPAPQIGSQILPLGISFFTFTQIGFLVDRKSGVTKARSFIEYLLFVTFFPHLIAGPILHHREIMPQFLREKTYRFDVDNFSVGLGIFTIGLAKKVLVADQFSGFVASGFGQPHDLSRMDAWCTVLSYFIQLYFDFSGYSEMAIGLARMFNVTFPANFDSPYKAPNVIEFWQRWHMSLTRYVTLYVYNPIALAITRRRYAKGKPANAAALRTFDGFSQIVALPTMVTMVLIGVWHGSGLQFLVFGALHGFYLCVAHAWRLISAKKKPAAKSVLAGYASEFPSILLTCGAVLVGQVFFRAHSVGDAVSVLKAMTLWPAAHVDPAIAAGGHTKNLAMIAAALAWVWTMPNTLQLFASQSPALAKSRAQKPLINITWRPAPVFGMGLGLLFLYCFLCVTGTTEFLYFRF